MTEKILAKKSNGFAMLLLFIVLYVAAFVGVIVCAVSIEETGDTMYIPVMVGCALYLLVGWVFFLGFKLLKPQEALVLTLFGKYIGTIKKEGFYFVNPFCVGVNPAAKTQLNQSGDVQSNKGLTISAAPWRWIRRPQRRS